MLRIWDLDSRDALCMRHWQFFDFGCGCAGHFDVYLGPLFEEVSTMQATFFVETLGAQVPVHEAAGALPLV